MKSQKKLGGGLGGWGGQGKCERRSEVFVNIQKNGLGRVWGVGGVRVDVKKKNKKKNGGWWGQVGGSVFFFFGGGGGRVDVNEEVKFK